MSVFWVNRLQNKNHLICFFLKIDYIYTEINDDYVYKDCCLVSEIDEYVKKAKGRYCNCNWLKS